VLFDTHAHYDSGAYAADRYVVLDAMNAAGVGLIIDPGCDLESSRAAVEIADRYDFVYAAVGWHPEELDSLTDGGMREIRRLAEHPKTVAVGEIGLDYYWDKERKDEQKALFTRQLDMATELDLPVIIHDREAHGDSLEIVSDYKGLRGVFHCYSGSPEMAEELLKRGWYLGFDGPVTYNNAKKQLAVLDMCPVDRILLETDSPYMTPVPHRGERNDSRMLKFIAERVAEVKHMSYDELVRITEENGRKLFKIGEIA